MSPYSFLKTCVVAALVTIFCGHSQATTHTVLVNIGGGFTVGHDTTNNVWWNDIAPNSAPSATGLVDSTDATTPITFTAGAGIITSAVTTNLTNAGVTSPTGTVYSVNATKCLNFAGNIKQITIGGLSTTQSYTFTLFAARNVSYTEQYALSGGYTSTGTAVTLLSNYSSTSTPPSSPSFEQYTFTPTSSTVTVTNSIPGGGSNLWGTLEITWSTAIAPTISGTAPAGTTGSAYTFTYTYTGTPSPSFTLGTGSTLPPGLSLNPSTAVISGTPTTVGTYTGTVVATNSGGSVSVGYSIAIAAPAASHTILIDIGSSVPVGHDTTNNLWWNDIAVNSTNTNLALIDSANASVPLTFSSASGSITGACASSLTNAGVTSPSGTIYSVNACKSLNFVSSPRQIVIGGLDTSGGTRYKFIFFAARNATYTEQYALTGGYTSTGTAVTLLSNYSSTTTPPSSPSFEVYGPFTPTAGTVTITATNPAGGSLLWGTVEIVTTPGTLAPTITDGPPPTTGTVGVPYSFTYTDVGFPTPVFSFTGSLPPGLTLSSAGMLSGIPTATGTYTGTVTATNSAGSNSQAFSITVSNPFAGQVIQAISCGNTSAYTGSTNTSYSNGTGTSFSADAYFSGGTATTSTATIKGPGTFDPTLYQNARTGPCTYSIPVPNGNYIVTLEYCETNPTATVGSRVFNVAIQGTTVLSNFDILGTPYNGDEGNANIDMPVFETFNATVTTGTLTVSQSNGTAGTPLINAILVRTVPPAPTKIAQGEYQLFYLVNGSLYANGSNREAEAGLSYPAYGQAPFPTRPIPVSGVTFTDVACGGYGSLMLDNGGYVWTCGINLYGEIGNGATDSINYTPTKILTDNLGNTFNNVKSVGSGFFFDAALKNDGTVWVWGLSGLEQGADSTGIIGDGLNGGTQFIVRPTQVKFPVGVSIAQISVGCFEIMALDTTGALWTWGGGSSYVADRGTNNSDPSTPTKVTFPMGATAITSMVQTGAGMMYAIDSSKNLYGWGQMGLYLGGSGAPINTPIAINSTYFPGSGFSGHVVAVATSSLSTHVLKDDGTLWGWGSSPRGEVGNGTMKYWPSSTPNPYSWDYGVGENMVSSPVQVLSNVAKVYSSCLGGSVYAVKTDGSIWSWGFDKPGFLGTGVQPYGVDFATYPDMWDVPFPTQVAPY